MKKWIAAILTMLMLMQALPLNALATIGNVLTEDELTAAYALTGFGESAGTPCSFQTGWRTCSMWTSKT